MSAAVSVNSTAATTTHNSNNNNNSDTADSNNNNNKELSSVSNANNTNQVPNTNATTHSDNTNMTARSNQVQDTTSGCDADDEVQDVVPAMPLTRHVESELHELQTEWSLWLYTNNKSRKWDENLQHVISFKTVEEFWAVYNHIQLSSKLSPGHDYALFRAGTRPAWEDEANKAGGRWMLSLNAKQHRVKDLDRLWLELMLLIIGEDFDTPDQSSLVVGAVVSIRFKEDRIALWTGDASRGLEQQSVGTQFKTRLGVGSTISFERHADACGGPKHKHKQPMYQV